MEHPIIASSNIDHLLFHAGLFQMECVTRSFWGWYVVGPILGLAVVSLLVVWLVLTYRHRLLQVWETRHINSLKRRSAAVSLLNNLCVANCTHAMKCRISHDLDRTTACCPHKADHDVLIPLLCRCLQCTGCGASVHLDVGLRAYLKSFNSSQSAINVSCIGHNLLCQQ